MASSYRHNWDQRLSDWGYVSLQVDSLAPRGITSICAGGMIVMETLSYRAKDAYLAKAYLSTLPCVDSDKIGVMGWSHGGTTAVKTVIASGEPQGHILRYHPDSAADAFARVKAFLNQHLAVKLLPN
jgi:dienelactone hydrolase